MEHSSQDLDDLWALMDVDGDGTVTLEEMKVPPPPEPGILGWDAPASWLQTDRS